MINLISDLTYMWIEIRKWTSSAEVVVAVTLPKPVQVEAISPLGEAVPPARRQLRLSPLNRRRWRNLKIEPARLLVALDGVDPVLYLVARGINHQRPAIPDPV